MRRAIGPRSASTQFTTTREVKSPVKSSVSTEYHTARRNIFRNRRERVICANLLTASANVQLPKNRAST
jgi:hypothetical protein